MHGRTTSRRWSRADRPTSRRSGRSVASPYYLFKRRFERERVRAKRERNLQLAEALDWAEKKINLQHEELKKLDVEERAQKAKLRDLRAENARLRAQPGIKRKKPGAHWRQRKRAIMGNTILGLVLTARARLDLLRSDPLLLV